VYRAGVRALWLEDRALRIRDDVPAPAIPRGEARIRVRLAGICNTDLELVRGYYPFTGVTGHEFVGEVEESPDAPEWTGRRVVGEINASCGRCGACRAGRRTHCPERTVLGIKGRHGAFAELLTLPVANLHAVPATLADQVAVFTEPVAAALEIQEQVKVQDGTRVVVVGAGKLGLLVAQTLALTGCALTVIVRRPEPRRILDGRGIATAGKVPSGEADVVVECTGNPEGLAVARQAVRPRGTIVLKSTYAGEPPVNLSSVVVDEVTLVGSRCGPFEKALAVLAGGRLDTASLIHAERPLAEALDAFTQAARPGVLKVLLRA
jgi:threonine dehydrogenase-like Zn-dependent dehydrogenase